MVVHLKRVVAEYNGMETFGRIAARRNDKLFILWNDNPNQDGWVPSYIVKEMDDDGDI